MPAQKVQCEVEPASDWTDVAGVNIFPYLGTWVLHRPRRLSVLQKRVIGTDGKLLKHPEGSSSSVLSKSGRSVIRLTGVWKAPNYLQVFQFYFAYTAVLGYVLEVSTPYGVQVFKIGKSVPRARGWSWALGVWAPAVLTNWGSRPLVFGLLPLIIFSGHWLLTVLLCKVRIVQCFWHRHFIIPGP